MTHISMEVELATLLPRASWVIDVCIKSPTQRSTTTQAHMELMNYLLRQRIVFVSGYIDDKVRSRLGCGLSAAGLVAGACTVLCRCCSVMAWCGTMRCWMSTAVRTE